MRTFVASLLVLASLVMAGGCQKSLPATVSGQVTIDGASLPEGANTTGEVMFYPSGGGAPAYGEFTSGGRYRAQTGTTSGLVPGSYKVTVRLVEIEPEPPGGYQNAPGQKIISPPRYNDIEKTDLEVTIQEGSNTLDLDLTTKP